MGGADVQPPLGGCVLKHDKITPLNIDAHPAAFRRLCVETSSAGVSGSSVAQPPLGGCVLKLTCFVVRPCVAFQPPLGGCVLKLALQLALFQLLSQPPLGGCVLKQQIKNKGARLLLPAAFRRLCVETYQQCDW